MVATQYLPPVTDTPAIGQLTGGPFSGSSLTVSTLQGTFPTPAAGQAFVAIVNPNFNGPLDNVTTERGIVTANASGTWTLLSALAHSHNAGEYVAVVLSTTWLDSLLASANNLSDVNNAGTTRANLHVPALTPVDACSNGLGNFSVSAFPATSLDTVALTSGSSLILLLQQTAASQNGVWQYNGSGSALTRPTEFASGASIKGRTVLVQGGSFLNSHTTWALTVPPGQSDTIDTTAQTWYPTATPYGRPVVNAYDPRFSPARTDTGCTVNAGSALVLDPSITAADAGSLISSPCWANYNFPVYVSSVVANTSFIASSSPNAVIPVPAGTSSRTDTVTSTLTSTATITDASILAADLGQPVFSGTTLWGYVGSGTTGVGPSGGAFTLSAPAANPSAVPCIGVATTSHNAPTAGVTSLGIGRGVGGVPGAIGIGTGGACTYTDTCIQNAINALPASGGQVYLPPTSTNTNGLTSAFYIYNPIIMGSGTNVACLVTGAPTNGGATDMGSTRTDTISVSGSTISDTSILATDVGAPVTIGSTTGFVTSVVAGTSFTLSTLPTGGTPITTATGTSMTITPTFFPATAALTNGFLNQISSTTGTTTTGGTSTTFTDPNASFNADCVGDPITIYGAGAAGAALVTTIAAVNSATSVTLATGASTALTGNALYQYGLNTLAAAMSAYSASQANIVTYTYVDSAGFHGCSYGSLGAGSTWAPVVGNSLSQGTNSTKNGVVLVGGSTAIANPATAVFGPPSGILLIWLGNSLPQNAVSGAAVIDVVGPHIGWGIENVYVNCNWGLGGGQTQSGHGIRITNGQLGHMENVSVNAAPNSGIMVRCWPWSSNSPLVGSYMNTYHHISAATASNSGWGTSIGININGPETTTGNCAGQNDTYFDTWDSIWVSVTDPGGSWRNYGVRFGQSDSCKMRGLGVAGAGHAWAVIFDYEGGNFGGVGSSTYTNSDIPFNHIIDGFGQGNTLGVASGGALTNGVNLGTTPTAGNWNRIVNVDPESAPATPPSYANLTWGNNATNVPKWGAQTFTSGAGAQCTGTSISVDNLAYITVTANGTLTIAISQPGVSSSYSTILNAATVVAGSMYTVRVPALCFLKITATTATYTTELQALA